MENTEVIENTMENVNEVAEKAADVPMMNIGIAAGAVLVAAVIGGGAYMLYDKVIKPKVAQRKAKKSENGEVEAKDDNYVTVEVIDK